VVKCFICGIEKRFDMKILNKIIDKGYFPIFLFIFALGYTLIILFVNLLLYLGVFK